MTTTPSDPIAYLRRLLDAGNHNDVNQMLRDRVPATRRYGTVFSDPGTLTTDDLAGFLLFENNRHWWGLQRRTDGLVRAIDEIRHLVGLLIDDTLPIADRVDAMAGGPPGFDREVWSPILLVTHPDTFGVWNAISESAMRRLRLWPAEVDDLPEGAAYARIDEMLLLVAADLRTDLWTVDALWWAAEKEHDPTRHFVRRGPRAATAPRPVVTRTATVRRTVGAGGTFVCRQCWTTKPVRLASSNGVCVDCA